MSHVHMHVHTCTHVCMYAQTTHHNSALLPVTLVKLKHVLEGVITDDITVQDIERLLVGIQDALGQCQWASCEERQASFTINHLIPTQG